MRNSLQFLLKPSGGETAAQPQPRSPLSPYRVLKMISSHRVDLQADVEVRPRAVELLPMHYLRGVYIRA